MLQCIRTLHEHGDVLLDYACEETAWAVAEVSSSSSAADVSSVAEVLFSAEIGHLLNFLGEKDKSKKQNKSDELSLRTERTSLVDITRSFTDMHKALLAEKILIPIFREILLFNLRK